MITIRTPSRLHFGLLGLAEDTHWPNVAGEPAIPGRAFGGVGLMVQDPGVQVQVSPSTAWSAVGPLAERALAFAQRYAAAVCQQWPDFTPACQTILVEHATPEHTGLGTGTQLGLAVAQALAKAWALDEEPAFLAHRIGRGLRSALGVYGFEHGGFLVEGGKSGADELSPLVARVPFPEAWRVVLILPTQRTGLHGPTESEAFYRLAQCGPMQRQTEALCRLVLLSLLPALVEGDVATFGEALHDFNARSGEMFAPVQGGIYATAAVAEVVGFVRRRGVKGVGQSSWGPTVFAVVENDDRATDLERCLRQNFGTGQTETIITRAWNHGAVIS
jgi:beta-RFAP synthase